MATAEETLAQIPFFNALSGRQVRKLAGKLKERQFKPGTQVVQEGKMSGIGFFVITDGQATVSVGGRELTTLGPGDHFGELGLIAERERTATVTAETPLAALELAVWDFRELVQSDPDVAWRLLQYVVSLLLDAADATPA